MKRVNLAERGFQTELWTDSFIQGLSPEDKLLFIYLWTNKHCNQAGLYEITLKTIAFDTGCHWNLFQDTYRNWSRKSPGIQSKILSGLRIFSSGNANHRVFDCRGEMPKSDED